jgi:bifunctional non-homologous end joining protein LigD
MLARPGQMPANDGEYGFEMKWDGIRALLYIDGGRAFLSSRNLNDITGQYPEVLPLAEEPGAGRLVLDGEIVALGEDGRPSFARLQNRMGVVSEETVRQLMRTTPVTYMIFDLLYRDGVSLMDEPYARRREALAAMRLSGGAWQTPGYAAGNGPAVLAVSQSLGLEGVVAKRLDSPYQPGKRSGAWLKIKNQLRQEFVIGGWLPGSGARSGRVGAILVGYYDTANTRRRAGARERSGGGVERRLVYAGKVGTGFTDQMLDELAGLLQPLRRATSPFRAEPGSAPSAPDVRRVPRAPIRWMGAAGAVFVEPLLVCEVEFTQWTPQGALRHPSFKGLRYDKDPREVIRET